MRRSRPYGIRPDCDFCGSMNEDSSRRTPTSSAGRARNSARWPSMLQESVPGLTQGPTFMPPACSSVATRWTSNEKTLIAAAEPAASITKARTASPSLKSSVTRRPMEGPAVASRKAPPSAPSKRWGSKRPWISIPLSNVTRPALRLVTANEDAAARGALMRDASSAAASTSTVRAPRAVPAGPRQRQTSSAESLFVESVMSSLRGIVICRRGRRPDPPARSIRQRTATIIPLPCAAGTGPAVRSL